MADIFISYAREDLDRAKQLARALESRGWSVWWDRRIVAGETFDRTIERELESAGSVVVLWSRDSIESEWTKNEASAAAERNVIVPALLDDVRIPLEFRRKQTANLIGWDGEASHEGFQVLCEGIAARIGRPAMSGSGDVLPPPPSPWPKLPGWRLRAAAGAVAVVAIAAGALWWMGGRTTDQPDAGGQPDATIAKPTTGTGPPPDVNGVDNPAPLGMGVPLKVTLQKHEDYYFRLSSPIGVARILQDMRLPDEKGTNLISHLSILDEHGGAVQERAINVNEVDFSDRKTAIVTLKPPRNVILRVLNTGSPADFWVAVLAADATTFIPLFGSVVPRPMSSAGEASGDLEAREDAYHSDRLTPGNYRISVDFTRVPSVVGNIMGGASLLDADGGNAQRLASFNEIDMTDRKVAMITVKKDELRILRIRNTKDTIKYAVKIAKAE
jgi:hypothetical protein